MYFVDNLNEHDASINLALEEYMIRRPNLKDDVVLFYINAPSIIIGRHQNTIEEINKDYVDEHNIRIVRRLSGGGAVYHDLGNLNFSFMTNYQPGYFKNFQLFTEPVIRCLKKLGVDAELSGRNDILIEGFKVSGNAQYISHGRMVSHGTLLFNSDLSHVADALKVNASKIASKGIKSVRSRVTNILEYIHPAITIEEFRQALLDTYFEDSKGVEFYPLTDEDWQAVHTLADERYRTWEWNYGNSPTFNVEKRDRFDHGEIDARLDVEKGIIRSAKFYGDYFAERETADLEKLLTGVRYERADIEAALKDVPINEFFAGMDLATFVKFLY